MRLDIKKYFLDDEILVTSSLVVKMVNHGLPYSTTHVILDK